MRTRSIALLAAVVAVLAVMLSPVATAQTQGDVEVRDQLIANQENLLNTYRCLFGVDVDVVPGGCQNPDVISPGPAPQNPTQGDIDVRDGLIQDQEALLNVYRCQFDVDTQLVPGGCASDSGTDNPSTGVGGTAPTVIDVLNTLTVEAEYGGSGYVRAEFDHDRRYLCDSSDSDPYTGTPINPSTCDVDHIVAAQEAYESGAWQWDVSQRQTFGNHEENLVASRDCVNRSKGARDIAEWSGQVASGVCEGLEMTAQGRCFFALHTVIVKSSFSLSVDTDEYNALLRTLQDCPTAGTTITTGSTNSQNTPIPTPPTADSTTDSDCHPAYSPCLPNLPGDALNCGDLTAAQKPVTVLTPGVDPYRLDRDGDGRGCTS